MIIGVSMMYLFTTSNAVTQQPNRSTQTTKVLYTHQTELTPSPPPKACSSKQRNFQTGVAFPQWGSMAYGESDTKWLTELPDMRTQTGACWVEIPILFSQASLIRPWMRNANLKMISVSAYLPLIDTPERVDPKQIFDLWKKTVKPALDSFALELGEPIFISEVGYRNSADVLYQSWKSTSSAPPDPVEPAAACDTALTNIISDRHILSSFFWGWDDVGAFSLNGMQAATVIHKHFESLQA